MVAGEAERFQCIFTAVPSEELKVSLEEQP